MKLEWTGEPRVLGHHENTQLILATLSIAGLQFAWGIEQAYFNVYLLELGMSKACLALIWLIGPISALIIHPTVGALMDYSTSQYGRRRPFMIWAVLFTGFSVIAFAFAKPIAEKLAYFHVSPLAIATCAVLVCDLAINVCQASSRTLIVDVIPLHQQRHANAWASRMSCIGHLVSFYMGSLDLETFFAKLGWPVNQLQGMCLCSAVLLVICVSITGLAVTERRLVTSPVSGWQRASGALAEIYREAICLDTKVAAICKVQLAGWYGWFTFLFYGSTFVAEVFKRDNPDASSSAMVRAGSRALALFSLSATFSGVALPMLGGLDIVKLWTVSYLVYGSAIFFCTGTLSYHGALWVFVACGLSWSVNVWAPYSLISERIHELPMVVDSNSDSSSNSIIEDELDVDSMGSHASNELEIFTERSGVIMGIHNCSITAPQVISTLGSFCVFELFGGHSNDGGESIGLTLKIGCFTAFVAAFLTTKLYSRSVELA